MKINKDIGHDITDLNLYKLEKKLKRLYDDCYKETKKEFDRVETILSQYKDSMTIEERERLWRKKGHLNEVLDTLTEDIRTANVTATNMINNSLLNVYEVNHNYATYLLESQSGFVIDSRLYNQEIIKTLFDEGKNPFTKITLNHVTDKEAIYKSLRNSFSQSIRLGESIQEISKRIQKIVDKNNYDSVRIARTETTRVESIGREEVFKKGEEMGLILKKVWISTIDSRTRESHLLLNGVAIDLDKTFDNGLLYPGDFNGIASEVINCRCSHIVEIQGVEKSANLQELDKDIKDLTFEEWRKRGVDMNTLNPSKNDKVVNRFEKEIKFDLGNMEERSQEKIINTLTDLSNEYNTRLWTVTNGKATTKGEKGHVGVDFAMNLSTSKKDTIVHEFAHTLTTTTSEKLKLTDDKEFWNEVKKIRREYTKEVRQGNAKSISSYADTELGEFMAEAFTHSYLKDTKELGWEFGNDFKYSDKVKSIIDKYFKRK